MTGKEWQKKNNVLWTKCTQPLERLFTAPLTSIFSVVVVHLLSHVSLRRNKLQQARFPCPSLSPRVFSNSWQLIQWYYPTISFSVSPFSCPQSFPVLGSFPMRQLFTSGSQSMGPLASFFPMNIQNWFNLGLTDLISLQSKGLSKVPPTPLFKKINSSVLSLLYGPTLTSIHDYWKNHSFDYTDLCRQHFCFLIHCTKTTRKPRNFSHDCLGFGFELDFLGNQYQISPKALCNPTFSIMSIEA